MNNILCLKRFQLCLYVLWHSSSYILTVAVFVIYFGSGSIASRAEEVGAFPSFWRQSPQNAQFLAPNPQPTLRIGAYVGALSEQSLIGVTVLHPWRPKIQSDSLVDVHAIYTAYRFASIPIDLEIEAGIAKHFGWSHQTEFNLEPMVRWKYFPWNDYVYTNFRLGLFGFSYDTSIPEWEKRQVGQYGRTSRFLSFLVPEFTFSPSKDAPFEVFVRVHHRSGIYGVIIKDQSSNYISGGIRFSVF